METGETEDRRLNQLFADAADSLVKESFSGVDAEWWWERRPDGGVAVCQVLEPEALVKEMSHVFGLAEDEVRRTAIRALGLKDFGPVELVHELRGDTSAGRAIRELEKRSSTSAGLAEGIYRTLAEAIRESATPRGDA